MPRLPVAKWSALVRDIVHLVIGYCRRHVIRGRVHVDKVEGGVEVVFHLEERLPMARHSGSADVVDRRTSSRAPLAEDSSPKR